MRSTLLGLVALSLTLWLGATTVARAQTNEEGFVAIFNGKDLTGWDGDPRLWSVKDGALRGETTPEKPAHGNTFCVWRGGKLKDFILKIKFRIQNGNSGIQYRSKEFDKWRITGYQAEVEGTPGKVGFLYHEGGRGWLVNVGDFMVIDEKGEKKVVSKVADVNALKEAGYYKDKDWNEYIIIAQGNYLRHYLNGYPTMALIDEDRVTDPTDPKDSKGAAREGILALQIHAGPPMVVEFKDISIKHLAGPFGNAVRLFNGENLDGWTPSSDALKDTFGVSGGVITDTGNPSGYLRTTQDFTNYALHLQMRHVKAGNSGVLIRIVGPDKVWPKSIECQGQSGSLGDIWNIDNFPMKVAPDRTSGRHTTKMHESNERPTGEWNDYDITLDGGNLEIQVNNLTQNTATECEEVPGKIGLQAEGSRKEFRNIVLVPIVPTQTPPAQPASDVLKDKPHGTESSKSQVAAVTDTKDAGKQKAQQLFGNGLEKGRRTFTWIDNPKAILEGTVHVVDGKTRFLEWLVGKEPVVFDVESSTFYDQPNGNLLAEIQTGKKATVTVDGRPLQVVVRLFKFNDDKSERAKAVYSSLGISLEGTAMVYQDSKLVFAAYKCGGKWFICEMKSATAKDAVKEGDLQEDSKR